MTAILLSTPITLLVALPLALYIKLVSPGPVFFSQERIGLGRRKFTLLKFRSMRCGASTSVHEKHLESLMDGEKPMQKMDGSDSRLIPLGKWIRASGLDELPQLLNVLKGEMSLVGPRPCTLFEFERYEIWQKERFNAMPGLTGLWQVCGKNRTTFKQMIELDIAYSREQSIWLDFSIIVRTLPALVVQVVSARRKSSDVNNEGIGAEIMAATQTKKYKVTTDHEEPSESRVVGCGYWGPNLIRNLNSLDGCNLKMICDTSEQRLAHMKKLYPDVTLEKDYDEMLKGNTVDAVAIATPVRFHHRMAKASLLAGKHTFIEKPMASSSAQCEELIAIAKEKKVTLMVGHTFLYSEVIRKIKKIVDSGDIGELRYISARRLNLGLFQKDINVTWDLAPHDISIILHIMGEEPVSVNCRGEAHVTPGIEDVTMLCLNFKNSRSALIHSSWLDPRKIREMTLVGAKRMIVYDDVANLEKIKVFDARVERPPHYDSFAEFHYSYHYGDMYVPYVKQEEPLKVQTQHFLDCIRDGKSPITSGTKGMQVVKILEAATESLKQGGAEVRLAHIGSSDHANSHADKVAVKVLASA